MKVLKLLFWLCFSFVCLVRELLVIFLKCVCFLVVSGCWWKYFVCLWFWCRENVLKFLLCLCMIFSICVEGVSFVLVIFVCCVVSVVVWVLLLCVWLSSVVVLVICLSSLFV